LKSELKSLSQTLTLNEELSIDIKYADDTMLIATILEKLTIST